jgi:hypothetical protein
MELEGMGYQENLKHKAGWKKEEEATYPRVDGNP